MRRGLAWAVLLAVVLASAGVATVLLLGRQPPRCVSGKDVPRVRVTGLHTEEYDHTSMAEGTLVHAGQARWHGQVHFPLVLGGASGICVTGGHIEGTWSQLTPWRTMHGTAGVVVSSPTATVQDLRVHDYGDAIRFVDQAQDWEVRRVWLSDVRDDCIENDWLHSGTVRDSFLDGCYNAFSARSYEGQSGVSDGSGNLFTVEHSLVWLRPMARTYNGEGEPGTAGFFKWDTEGPQLSLHDDVFRADQRAGTVGLGIPPGKLVGCSGNVMVWLGKGRYPNPLPRCFRLTRDVGVWNRAVRQWRESHSP